MVVLLGCNVVIFYYCRLPVSQLIQPVQQVSQPVSHPVQPVSNPAQPVNQSVNQPDTTGNDSKWCHNFYVTYDTTEEGQPSKTDIKFALKTIHYQLEK